MKCGNDECGYRDTDIAMTLTSEMANFCHECTECGWYKRVPRMAYHDAVAENRKAAGLKDENDD